MYSSLMKIMFSIILSHCVRGTADPFPVVHMESYSMWDKKASEAVQIRE